MANKFNLDDTVFLVDSARTGSLESFKVVALRQDTDGAWYYKFGVPQRPPAAIATLGDRITKKRSYDFELAESELLIFCDAVDMAESYLQAQLNKIQTLRAQYCGT